MSQVNHDIFYPQTYIFRNGSRFGENYLVIWPKSHDVKKMERDKTENFEYHRVHVDLIGEKRERKKVNR